VHRRGVARRTDRPTDQPTDRPTDRLIDRSTDRPEIALGGDRSACSSRQLKSTILSIRVFPHAGREKYYSSPIVGGDSIVTRDCTAFTRLRRRGIRARFMPSSMPLATPDTLRDVTFPPLPASLAARVIFPASRRESDVMRASKLIGSLLSFHTGQLAFPLTVTAHPSRSRYATIERA